MKLKQTMAILAVAALPLLVVGAGSQHAEHHPAKAQAKSQMTMGQGMMGQGMMGGQGMMMGKNMMMHQQQAKKLVAQLTKSFAAMEGENDLAAIKKELAADRALLHQLQSTLDQGRNMMGKMMGPMMEHMKTCPMRKSGTK